jgi:hypothetical protein
MLMRYRRALAAALLLVFGLATSGCSTFDPTEWFSTKKPLPGERKAVFPEGVPGVPQGVPPELVEGYKPPAEPVPEPRVVEEKPKPKPRVAAKPKPKPAPAQAAAPRPAPATTSAAPPPGGPQAPWPDAPPPRSAAPTGQSVFPDPPSSAR